MDVLDGAVFLLQGVFVDHEAWPVGRSGPRTAINPIDRRVLAHIRGQELLLLGGVFVLDLPDVGVPAVRHIRFMIL